MTPTRSNLEQWEFGSYEDYLKNYRIIAPEHFNFAFDVLDLMARETPDARALQWCTPEGEERGVHTFRTSAGVQPLRQHAQVPGHQAGATWSCWSEAALRILVFDHGAPQAGRPSPFLARPTF
jgi:hypothetical protein